VRPLLVAVLALALVPGASARNPSPCSLLSNDEVAAAFSSKVDGRAPGMTGLAHSCTWTGPPLSFSSERASLQLSVVPEPEAPFLTFERETNGQPVHGVGEAAIWIQKLQMLSAWDRGYTINITIFGPYVPAPLSAARTLAKAALTHV